MKIMNNLVAVFPGQGAQYVGMGKSIYERYEVARKTYKEADEILDFELSKICFEGNVSKLNTYRNMFPAILTTSMAFYRVFLEELEMIPDYFIGHSLGEYGALTACGVLSFKDALKIVRLRGEMSSKASNMGTMSVVEGLDESELMDLCRQAGNGKNSVFISCYNSEKQMSVSGMLDAVVKLETLAREHGAMVTPLIGSGPMHSPCMDIYQKEFSEFLEQFEINRGEYNVVSNVTGKVLGNVSKEKLIDLLTRHFVWPVKWMKSVEYVSRYETPVFVEMSAKAYMNRLIEAIIPKASNYCYGVKSDCAELKQDTNLLFNKQYNGSIFDDMIRIGLSVIPVSNPNYDKNKVKQYIQELKNLEGLCQNKQEQEQWHRKGVALFRSIMIEKGADINEVTYWCNKVMNRCSYVM